MTNMGMIGVFGNNRSTYMSEAKELVNEYMADRKTADDMSKADIAKYLDAFEIMSAMQGLNPQQMQEFSKLLMYC